jgi:hypothetical protein
MALTDERAFGRRLAELAQFHAKELDLATVRTYWDTLSPLLDDEAFAAACDALKAGDWWPTPARILRAADLAGSFERSTAVTTLYERIRACDEFGPAGGSCYRLATIRKQCGEVAERLAQAVGGSAAFERALRHPDDEPFLRKAFLEAARDLYRVEPGAIRELVAREQARLPGGRKALTAGR